MTTKRKMTVRERSQAEAKRKRAKLKPAVAWQREWADEHAEGAVVWDDCDDAIIGAASRCAMETCLVYDYEKLVQVFLRDGMTYEEAAEYVDFNILGAFVCERTPLIFFPIAEPQ